MIQRIQHLYLLAISAICIWLSFSPIITLSVENANSIQKNICSNSVSMVSNGIPLNTDEYVSIFIMLILIAACSIISIFLFKKRNVQEVLGYINYLLIVIFIILLMMKFFDNIDVNEFPINSITNTSIIKIVLIFGLLLLNFLSIKGIKADEDLIKSADRIR